VWTVARAPGPAPAAPDPRAATLLLVRLHTGRRHQIRIQAAARGHALLGDRRYAPAGTSPTGHGAGHRRNTRYAARRPAAAGSGAGWPLLHAAAIGSDALTHAAAVVAPLPAAARQAIARHFGAAAPARASAAVARQLAGHG
jgi:hypothetical protein